MAKHAVHRKKKRSHSAFSFRHALVLCLCVIAVCFGLYLCHEAFTIGQRNPSTESEDDFRPTIGEPPYRIAVDAGHGGSDPGARGVVEEKEMTAATAEALLAWLEQDPNFIPLRTRENYDITAKPSERAAAANALSPDLLLSIHGNSAPEGSTASGFECYPTVPGRTWHRESYYFAKQLASAMRSAGASLRGRGGIRYIVLAEQCFVTSEADVAQFGSEDGCQRTARAYYEAICAYFETTPLPE